MSRLLLRELEQLMPPAYARIALMWAAQQLEHTCDIRDGVSHTGPLEDAIYKQATDDFRRLAHTWDGATR